MYLLGEIKGQCLIVLSFCYGIMLMSKLTLITNTELYCSSVRFFCLDTVINHHRASRERQSERVFAITPNTEGSPRNSCRETYNGCIIVQKIPLKILSGILLFGYNNATVFCA